METEETQNFCPYCMAHLDSTGICTKCGRPAAAYTPSPHHLLPGSILQGRYLVGGVLGEGGFGITYIGCDLRLEMKVAIKEYYPVARASRNATVTQIVSPFLGKAGEGYERGKMKVLAEAKTLAKLDKLPAIVSVKDYFQTNQTAYIVMEYVDGMTFNKLVEHCGGKIPPQQLFPLLEPLFDALEVVHQAGLIHRDISPDNLMIENGLVRLLDFGCVRETESDQSQSTTIAIKQGYAPPEQYQQNGQGPWTDVYALCATIYYCLTGTPPPQAFDRIAEDTLMRPTKLGIDITERQEAALIKGLSLKPLQRIRSVKELHNALYGLQDAQQATASSNLISTTNNTDSDKVGPFEKTRIIDGSDTAVTSSGKSHGMSGITIPGNVTTTTKKEHSATSTHSDREKAETSKGVKEKQPKPETKRNVETTGKKLHASISNPPRKALMPIFAAINCVIITILLVVFFSTAKVPVVSGMKLNDAQAMLAKSSLNINDTEYVDSSSAKGVVISCANEGKRIWKKNGVSLVISRGTTHAVPYVVGSNLSEAKEALGKLNFVVVENGSYSDTVAKGTVLQQTPAKGSILYEGENVSLSISLGPTPFKLPDVSGETAEAVNAKLLQLGLDTKMRHEDSTSVAINGCIRLEPEAGSLVQKNDTVVIVVSDGTLVPDLKGKSLDQAQEAIRQSGLQLVEQDRIFHDEVDRNLICEQDIAAKTHLEPGSVVSVTVSRGIGVSVPNLLGMAQTEAAEVLKKAGLKLEVEESTVITYSLGYDKLVGYQSEPADTLVEKESTIYVKLYTYVPAPTAAPAGSNSSYGTPDDRDIAQW